MRNATNQTAGDWDMAESADAYFLWLNIKSDSHNSPPRLELSGRNLYVFIDEKAEPRVFQLPADADPSRLSATIGRTELELWLPKAKAAA